MLILAADTSLPVLSVALLRDDAILGAVSLEGKGSRNEKLLPAIDWLLRECGIERMAIDLFASTRGPGSFTGVRIGLATLQGLALVMDKPVCAMPTHDAILWAAGEPQGRSVVVDDAGRGEFYTTAFDGPLTLEGPRLSSSDDRARLIASGREIYVPDAAQSVNVAVGCARRTLAIARRGDLERWSDITPLYVRLAEAEVKLQQGNDSPSR